MAFTAGNYVTTLAQVNDYMRSFTITSSTNPSDADVSESIAEREAELNVALRDQGYSVPLSEATDIEWARGLVAKVAAYDTFVKLWEGNTLPDKYKAFLAAWEKALERIYKGQVSLAGETALGDEDPYFTTARMPNRDYYWSTSVED